MTTIKTPAPFATKNNLTPAELALWEELEAPPTEAQLAIWAVLDAALAARKSAGILNGRDWTGVAVAHAENCICQACVSDALWAECKARNLVSDTALPHSSAECPGNCRRHPLLDAAALAFRAQEDLGKTWGDIAEITEEDVARTVRAAPTVTLWLVTGGFPCQGLSASRSPSPPCCTT
jgi:hypothetical protein